MAEVSRAAGRIQDTAARAPLAAEHQRTDARRVVTRLPHRVAALAGRMLDDKPDSAPTLAATLQRSFIDEGIETLVCSAARGTDLLALDAAGGLGIRRVVVLPFSVAEFRDRSVAGHAGPWENLYAGIIKEVQERGDLVIDKRRGATYQDANTRILAEARALAGDGHRPLAFVVWEGQSRDARDVTAAFRHEAEKDFDVRDILL